MKTILKIVTAATLISILFFTGCRKEEMEVINPPQDETLTPNSTIANLIQRTATNDGSNDNIIDNSNCFNIQLPATVFANGYEIIVDTEQDFNTIEAVFDEFEDDIDTIEIQFPITVILTNYTEVVINNAAELNTLSNTCNGENEEDDDIECIDFQYPITASVFNTNNQLIDTIIINDDSELYNFISNIDENDIVNIQFPITVILSDGTLMTISDLNMLEITINNFEGDCDEDDDNDYNDDDCDDCTNTQLIDLITDCTDWMVDKLERNDNDLEDNYVGYTFNFLTDGTINVTSGNGAFSGNWSASGSGNTIAVIINITGLLDFNDTWTLHEIEQETGEKKIDLRLGNDRLRFESDCLTGGNNINDTALVASLTMGDWYVTYYFDDTDETTNYNDYTFNFASNGTATATDSGGVTNGNWSTSLGDETDLELNLNFGTTTALDEVAEDWDVLEITNDIIRLKDISGGDGSVDYLTFERTSTGNGGNNLITTLSNGLWIVTSYINDGENETDDYNGFQLNFNNSGTVIATDGTTTNNGTWAVQSSGNIFALNFLEEPFNELNDDDWDVISVTDVQVTLQDVSGGDGGTSTLTLQKI